MVKSCVHDSYCYVIEFSQLLPKQLNDNSDRDQVGFNHYENPQLLKDLIMKVKR